LDGRADDRNSGNQIAYMLADPFDLIHQIQRFIDPALTSSALHQFKPRLR
jgi:hypothetical protein